MTRLALLLSAAVLPLAACAPAVADEEVATASDASRVVKGTEVPNIDFTPDVEQGAQLRALFAKSDADNLDRNPIGRLFRGDYSRAGEFGDGITDEYFARERAANAAELAQLANIDRDALSPTDRIAYDVFRWQQETARTGLGPEILPLTVVRPIDHFSG